jgi:small-conductance mechanosensitive channel
VRNTDGVIVNYPNHLLANSVITNFSFEGGAVRVRVRFHVARGADIEQVQRVAGDAVRGVDGVLPETVEVVARSMWDESRGHLHAGILMEARYRIVEVRTRTRIRSTVIAALERALVLAQIPCSSPLVTVRSAPD